MPQVPDFGKPEPVSEAVRRTMQHLADTQAGEARLKEKIRESQRIHLPPKVPKVAESPRSSRSNWASVNATPVGIACSQQVAAVFQRGEAASLGLVQTPIIVDARLSPAKTEFFYDSKSWEERRKAQEAWESRNQRKP